MFRGVIILLFVILLVSCKSQKAQDGKAETKEVVNESRKVSYNVHPEIIESKFQPEQQQLKFQISNAELVNSELFVSVKYGGGCKAHEFKLFYSQAKGDTLNFHLLHLTTDDHCKAYVFNALQFDLSGIPIATSIVLVNGQEVIRK